MRYWKLKDEHIELFALVTLVQYVITDDEITKFKLVDNRKDFEIPDSRKEFSPVTKREDSLKTLSEKYIELTHDEYFLESI